MKPLYILKIGGSVATYKNRSGAMPIRRTLLAKVAQEIKRAQEKKPFDLVLIHGAGAVGHQLAHEYGLKEGAQKDPKKWYGSLISRVANQLMNNMITEILIDSGLRVTSVHTASAIIQRNNKIEHFDTNIIEEALRQGCIPMLYGEMVFDRTLGMTICSGDAIAPYLAKKFKARKMFFASDIDGIFTKDPHKHKDARLIEKVTLRDVHKHSQLSGSHYVDTTGGLMGKISNLADLSGSALESIEIFNGLHSENYFKALCGEHFPHTTLIT